MSRKNKNNSQISRHTTPFNHHIELLISSHFYKIYLTKEKLFISHYNAVQEVGVFLLAIQLISSNNELRLSLI